MPKEPKRPVTSRRRNVVESSETRTQLLDTAELIMKEEGFPAVTTRRLASRMGVSNQLVHYYFRTMDELFVSLMRRGAERTIARLVKAVASDDPLRELLKFYSDAGVAKLQIEYLALLNHRKDISHEAVRVSAHMRSLEAEVVARVVKGTELEGRNFPSMGLAVILSAIGRIIAIEETVGISLGHAEAVAILEHVITSFEKAARAQSKAARSRAEARKAKR